MDCITCDIPDVGCYEQCKEYEGNEKIFVELGNTVKDEITGFTGKVTARAEYLYDETKVLVENIDTTGRPVDWWFTENRVEVIKEDE